MKREMWTGVRCREIRLRLDERLNEAEFRLC